MQKTWPKQRFNMHNNIPFNVNQVHFAQNIHIHDTKEQKQTYKHQHQLSNGGKNGDNNTQNTLVKSAHNFLIHKYTVQSNKLFRWLSISFPSVVSTIFAPYESANKRINRFISSIDWIQRQKKTNKQNSIRKLFFCWLHWSAIMHTWLLYTFVLWLSI